MLGIGIISPSNIAFNRFLPSLMQSKNCQYIGVGIANADEWDGPASKETICAEKTKAQAFQDRFGGSVFSSYQDVLDNPAVQAVYLPLPPALHYKWGKKVLEAGKHLLMEKPFTTNYKDTVELLALAREKNLCVHENYMFQYHSQLAWIEEQIRSGKVGEIRMIRAAFGFPFRGSQDFRYNKKMGGGALLDCGGYPVRLAMHLLGADSLVITSQLAMGRDLDVDLYGSATIRNPSGQIAQISFGMDNSYKCELEIWGSTGCLVADRVFTAPAGYSPIIRIKTQDNEEVVQLLPDDAFMKSIDVFVNNIHNEKSRCHTFEAIRVQAKAIQAIMEE